ncbi:hypothetical protein B7755_031960 [Streptomyces sp. NBS 14/10]|uniref:hypothetical protein n=1 Tax=Streptomyces sp. NBS 14/10 TaxID=1945643 RepID=UPI00117CDE0F|nr:hypothetical protein [Streptomyces sp. NBS 14/10]KAK1182343.1 hypothetical protein B7755_031960 [Streptomyces sp. NBS 14/10]
MDVTRRTLLRGLSAAPLAAAAGGLVLPVSAHAASSAAASEFRVSMREHPLEPTSYTYPSAIAGLANELTAAPLVQEVLRNADRKAVANPHWPAGTKPSRLAYSFGWDPEKNDGTTGQWYPQGVSSSYDAYHGPIPGTNTDAEKRAVVVSWYAKGAIWNRGARVTFVDVTVPSRPRYRHVLLVEPKKSAGEPYDFSPVGVHAGGIAWYGDRLYLADTRGGLRVFNVNQMFKVDTPPKNWCGYHAMDNKYYAYDCQYVLPQSRAYDNAGAALNYSQVSVDHTTAQPSLLVSEFRRSGKCRVVRWYMNPQTSSITSEEAVGQRTFNRLKVQGAVSVDSRYYFSVSDGPNNRGSLYRSRRGRNTPMRHGYLSIGPEDLSYDGDRDGIWGLGEYPRKRRVYVVGR